MRYKMANILIKSLFKYCPKNFYESFQQKKRACSLLSGRETSSFFMMLFICGARLYSATDAYQFISHHSSCLRNTAGTPAGNIPTSGFSAAPAGNLLN